MEIAGRAELHDPPGLHHRDVIGNIQRLSRVMRYQHHRRPRLAQQDAAITAQLAAQHDIDAGEGFIHQQHPRPRRHRAGERGALLLPARKFVRITRAHARQPDAGEPASHLGAARAWQAKADIGGDGHMREQRAILKHQPHGPRFGRGAMLGIGQHLAAQHDAAALHRQQSGGKAKQC